MPKWMPSFDLTAQLGHSGWGALIPCIFGLFHHVHYGIYGMLAFAFVKEFIFDAEVEGQTFQDNAKDFAFYGIGITSGAILVLLSVHFFPVKAC